MAHSTLEEEIQIHRVFRYLSYDLPRIRLEKTLEELEHRIDGLLQADLVTAMPGEEAAALAPTSGDREESEGRSSNGTADSCGTLDTSKPEVKALRDQHGKLSEKLKALLQRESDISSLKITQESLHEAYKHLGVEQSAVEIEETIWEVNDSLDGMVSYEEFMDNFYRCKNDNTGIQPLKLYSLVSFLMYDRDSRGSVSIDQLMQMLYLRHGHNRLQLELEALLGEDLPIYSSGEKQLTFTQYYVYTCRRRDQLIDKHWFKMTNGTMVPKTPLPGW